MSNRQPIIYFPLLKIKTDALLVKDHNLKLVENVSKKISSNLKYGFIKMLIKSVT